MKTAILACVIALACTQQAIAQCDTVALRAFADTLKYEREAAKISGNEDALIAHINSFVPLMAACSHLIIRRQAPAAEMPQLDLSPHAQSNTIWTSKSPSSPPSKP